MECKGQNEGKNKGQVGSIFIWEEKEHISNLLEGSQILPARPCDMTIIQMKTQASDW
jgi:hypothetical protein